MFDQIDRETTSMVIAHVTSYYVPGLGYQENFLPFEQARMGHNVHIITGDRFAPHPSYSTVYEPRVGPRIVGRGTQIERDVTIHRLPVPFELQHHNNPWIRGSVSLLDRLKPDIVHLHGVTPWSSLGVMFSGAARRHRLVCDHHLCEFNLMPFTAAKRAFYMVFRTVWASKMQCRVRAWLPINEDAKNILSDIIGISGDNVFINRLGVDCGQFRHDLNKGASWRHKHEIPNNAQLFVHAGRLERRKNLEDLIKAVTAASSENASQEYWVCIAGDGDESYIRDLKSQAEALGISDKTIFLGMQPHDALPDLFNAADVGIWPGDVSITLIEALGCGLPIALPENPGLSYVANCLGAFTFEKSDVAALTGLMPKLLATGASERKKIAAACAERLGWQAIALQATDIYRGVIARSSAMQ